METRAITLAEFLAARLDEKEHFARIARLPAKHRERMLREVEAGRAILALHEIGSEPGIKVIEHHDKQWNTGWIERQETGRLSYWCATCDYDRDYGHIGGPREGCDTLRHWAAVDNDHPDYRQEWAP